MKVDYTLIRCFICVEVTNQININKIETILDQLSEYKGIRQVKPNQLHLTLKFLGEVPEEKLLLIERQLNSIKFRSFEIEFSQLGFFPNERRPRVVWIGISKGKDELTNLAREVDEKMLKIGFPKEKRKFSSHLTLGRIKKYNPDEIQKLVTYTHSFKGIVGERETIGSILFKKSTLTPQGAIYQNLSESLLEK